MGICGSIEIYSPVPKIFKGNPGSNINLWQRKEWILTIEVLIYRNCQNDVESDVEFQRRGAVIPNNELPFKFQKILLFFHRNKVLARWNYKNQETTLYEKLVD